jgi:hypothetical protein
LAVVIAAAIGVTLMVGLVAYVGFDAVLAAIARIGVPGFAAFSLYTLANFAVLAGAWFVLTPKLKLQVFPALYWGRLMREAASDVLPFSQLGGLVIGSRAAATLGAPPSATQASTVVDISTELVGQLLFTFLGLGLVATGVGGSSIRHGVAALRRRAEHHRPDRRVLHAGAVEGRRPPAPAVRALGALADAQARCAARRRRRRL